MQDVTSVVLAVAALFLAGPRAEAWSGAGHQVIAAEAYRALSPALQKKVVQVLAAHPRYATWKEAAGGDTRSDEFGIEIFMRASTWADEIRRHESQYNHPRWHFIDYPLKPPKFPLLPDASPDDDILYAIQRCEQTLSGHKASPEERAVYLAWLIHLIGDLHQPLHCASLFDAAHPKGDKGGNDFFVKPGERGITLHAFWDELLGTSGKPLSASELRHRYPGGPSPELAQAAQEGAQAERLEPGKPERGHRECLPARETPRRP